MNYQIKASSRARRMSIVVRPGGIVVVTVPTTFSPRQRRGQGVVSDFVLSKAEWIARAVARMKWVKPKLMLGVHGDYKKLRKDTERFVRARVREINEIYNFEYNKVIIRNQRTRWGSCSRAGNLSFNYRIILLPPELQDYLIAHELCHLEEFNHSSRFWTLVAKVIPDYKLIKRDLKAEGLNLQ